MEQGELKERRQAELNANIEDINWLTELYAMVSSPRVAYLPPAREFQRHLADKMVGISMYIAELDKEINDQA